MAEKRKSEGRAMRGHKTLRDRAEAMLRATRTDIAGMAQQDFEALVHELQVHQAELEIQNEELRLAQLELAQSRDRYGFLYDFAPVGYITVNAEGRILEANLTAHHDDGCRSASAAAWQLLELCRPGRPEYLVPAS